ncbi:MAG: universal stress protein [Flavobacteriales bacterium]
MNTGHQSFKKILFGFAFSPKLKINLLETIRIAHFFNAKLILLHVGEKTKKKEDKIYALLQEIEPNGLAIDIQWKEGKPIKTIRNACVEFKIDLLILGALQHENMYRFYVGSIARKLTRQVSCSVLLLIRPSDIRVPCNHLVVNGLNAPDTSNTIANAFYVANTLGAKQITIVEEILNKEIHVDVEDDRSLKRASIIKERLKHREESRVRKIVGALPKILTQSIKIKNDSIFGKRGYSIGHYAEVVRGGHHQNRPFLTVFFHMTLNIFYQIYQPIY